VRRGRFVDEREADATAGLEDDQRVIGGLVEPARQVVGRPSAALVERVVGVVELGEIVQVEGIDAGQSLPIGWRAPRVAQLDAHGAAPAGRLAGYGKTT